MLYKALYHQVSACICWIGLGRSSSPIVVPVLPLQERSRRARMSKMSGSKK